MKISRKVSAGVLCLTAMALVSIVIGAQESLPARDVAVGHSVKIIQGPEGVQVLYVLDPLAGKIAVYEFDPAMRKLRLCSVTPIEGRPKAKKGANPIVAGIAKADDAAYVYIVDRETGKIVVYRHGFSNDALVLMAVTDWAVAMKLDYYNAGPNGKELTPEMIRKNLPRK